MTDQWSQMQKMACLFAFQMFPWCSFHITSNKRFHLCAVSDNTEKDKQNGNLINNQTAVFWTRKDGKVKLWSKGYLAGDHQKESKWKKTERMRWLLDRKNLSQFRNGPSFGFASKIVSMSKKVIFLTQCFSSTNELDHI